MKVVQSLTAKGFAEEVDAKRDDPVWRSTGEGHAVTLVVTAAAFAALGIEPGSVAAEPKPGAKRVKVRRDGRKEKHIKVPRTPRTDTKQSQLIGMLQRTKGASIEEIAEALGWQHHTVRGAIAGALKKKLGLDVVSEDSEKRGRIYRIDG